MSALELLSGDAQTFIDKVWATRVHLHRTDPADLVGLLSFEDVDTLLSSTAIRTPSVRIAQDGIVLPEARFTRRGATMAGKPITGLVDPRKVFSLFDAGATVVLQGLHRYHPRLRDLVAELELELGHPCQVNAYLTPPGSQGFAVHSDTHDVFVFQTHGSKMWEVHHADAPGGREDVLLEPGLSMYLPTGTPHAARAQEGVSLHVTVGVNQLTWRGLIRRSVEVALAEVPDEHLPAGYLDNTRPLAEGLGAHLQALAREVAALDPDELTATEVRRFLRTRPARLPGGLRDVLAARTMNDTTRLRRRRGHPCVVVDSQDASRVDILLGDRVLTVPAWVRPAVAEVASRLELRPADLDLDPQSRVVLCRRLVREGLLEVVE